MGFNIEGQIKLPSSKKYILELERELAMLKQEQPKKSKRKMNFDNLFPRPKDQGNSMGLDDFGNKKRRPFEGIL